MSGHRLSRWTLSSMCMSASNVVLSRMQLTFHATRPTPHGASRLVQATSAWSAKTRRSPSRHYRDARVYGHTTTAMHDNEYAPPPTDLTICKKVRSHKRSLVGCNLPFMRLREHLTALRAWCKLMSAWSVKPDVLSPGIVGMRGSMVIRLRPCMTMSTPPHPLPTSG